jgi:hypothetical protein
LDAAQLTPGQIMDALYNRLYAAVFPWDRRAGQKELRSYLEWFGTFYVDFCWTEPDEHGPSRRLARAIDALLRLEADGKGWQSEAARGHLTVALEELRLWAASL